MNLKDRGVRGLQRQARDRQIGAVNTAVDVALDEIIVDETIQVRQNGLDQDRVEQYALAMVEYGGWGEFPPLVVFRDPDTDKIRLAGGFHRRAAIDGARQRLVEGGKEPVEIVPCDVRTGDRAVAVEFAEDDNLQHGLNLSSRDKRHIYWRRLTEGHVWIDYSNRRIAADLGVGEATIRRWLAELKGESGAPFDAPDNKVGKDGKRYPAQSGTEDEEQAGDSPEPDHEEQGQSASSGQPDEASDPALSGNRYQIDDPTHDDYPDDESEFGEHDPGTDQNATANTRLPSQPILLGKLTEATVMLRELRAEIERVNTAGVEHEIGEAWTDDALVKLTRCAIQYEGWEDNAGEWHVGVSGLLDDLYTALSGMRGDRSES